MKTPYAHSPRPVANTYLRRDRDRRRRRELALVALGVLVPAIGLFVYTWIQLETLGVGYRIDSLERKLHRLERQERLLRLEAADLAQPGKIEALAAERFGMGPQTVAQTLYLEELR